MTQTESQPMPPPGAPAAAPRRATLGKIALVLSLVPWAIILTLALLIQPT